MSKRYGALVAVDDVTFTLEPGEVVGLIGANGAGKSTLMRLLSGAEQPDEGQTLLDGEPVVFASPRQAIVAGIAIVPQELSLIGDQSVAENLLLGELPRRVGIVDQRRLFARARQLLVEVGLEVDPARSAGDLTPVAQRLVGIAQALAREPKVLVLDEPSASLPVETAARLEPLVAKLAEAETAVVYVSHRLDEVRAMCERVVAMRDGSVAGTLRAEEIEVDRMVVLVGGNSLREAPRPAGPVAREAEPVIEARGIRGRRVQDVSLTVARGELLGVGGLHGSGRSELLRLIGGVQALEAGSIELFGVRGPTSPRAAAKRGIGYLAEGRAQMLFADLPTLANASITMLSAVSRLRTVIDGGRERALVSRAVHEVGLKGDLDAEITTLSGGNQQKVCLARWLLRGSEVLLLDEPTVGIDVHARAEIHRILRTLAAGGTTIVVASAEPEELAVICDRVVVLVEGRLGGELQSPLTAEGLVRASYGGERVATTHEAP